MNIETHKRRVEKEPIQKISLRRARDFAGGVSYLAHHLGVTARDLDAFIQGYEPIPQWLFLRAVDFMMAIDHEAHTPPGMPNNWRDGPPATV